MTAADPPPTSVRIAQRIADVAPQAWNGLAGTDNPFLRHEFLNALEVRGCVEPANGWQPFHLLLYQQERLVAAAPAYVKGHSWGEFVFDWSWADAHARRGLSYYPKLIAAVPYSPVTGPRVLVAPGVAPAAAAATLAAAARDIACDNGLSSAHWLFTDRMLAARLRSAGYDLRLGYQFHWANQDYQDFEQFLAALTSKKRKNIRQERRRILEAGVRFEWLHGQDVTEEQWRAFERFYRNTFRAHGNIPLMTAAFFRDVGRALGDRLLLVVALHRGEAVAAALFLRSDDTLYGRYWGSSVELSGLHFETCYYQGIDYCIEHRLARFEPGAQGEHKVPRGFLPAATYSAHWLRDEALRRALADFLSLDRARVEAHMEDVRAHSPFRLADSS